MVNVEVMFGINVNEKMLKNWYLFTFLKECTLLQRVYKVELADYRPTTTTPTTTPQLLKLLKTIVRSQRNL
jgi:hypothetical protein